MATPKKKESLEEGLAHSATKKGLTGEAKQRYIGGSIENMRKSGRLPAHPAKKKAPEKKGHGTEKRYEELLHKRRFGSMTSQEIAEYQKIAPHWHQKAEERINNDPHFYVVVQYRKTKGGKVKKHEQAHREKDIAESSAKADRQYVPLLYEKVEVEARLKDRFKKGKK